MTGRFAMTLTIITALTAAAFLGSVHPAERPLRGIKLIEQLSIETTSDAEGQQPYHLEWAADIYIDGKDQIYVLDQKQSSVYKFSPAGLYLRTFEFGQTQGQPYALSDVAVDADGNVYVANSKRKSITVADSTGAILKTFPTEMRVSDMEVGRDDHLYISGLSGFYGYPGFLTYAGPIIHQVTPSGNVAARFCERRPVGTRGGLAVDQEGNIYYTFRYPYEIRKFSPDHRLVMQVERTVTLAHPPALARARVEVPGEVGEERELEVTDSVPAESWKLIVMPDGTMLHLLYQITDNQFRYFFDVFDRTGTWLMSIPAASPGFPVPISGFWIFGGIATDRRGHLYVSLNDTASHAIKKYTIEYVY